MSNDTKKTDWIPVLVTCVVFLFATSILLYAVSENRRNDNEYFKNRLATLEARMNQQDKRVDAMEESLKKINSDIKDMSILVVQINNNVLENSKKIDDIVNPPKPVVKRGRPKSAFKKPEPVIQGPKPEPPVRGPGIPHTGGSKPETKNH